MLMNIFRENLISLQFKSSFCVAYLIKRTNERGFVRLRCGDLLSALSTTDMDLCLLRNNGESLHNPQLSRVLKRGYKYNWYHKSSVSLPTLSHSQITCPCIGFHSRHLNNRKSFGKKDPHSKILFNHLRMLGKKNNIVSWLTYDMGIWTLGWHTLCTYEL